MADSFPTNSPAAVLENPEPITTSNFNSEPTAKEEPQDQMTFPPPLAPLPDLVDTQLDTIMTDVVVSHAIIVDLLTLMDPQPSSVGHPPSATATPTPTPVPQRTATPTRNITNGQIEPGPIPLKAAAHGAPVRRYLNEKVTGVLLEGMKRLVIEQ